MRKSFIDFLAESQGEGERSFYNIYCTEFPSKKVQGMKAGKKKDKAKDIEEIKYANLMTDFLRNAAAMN